jgi:hypothetical protein
MEGRGSTHGSGEKYIKSFSRKKEREHSTWILRRV